MGQHIARRFIAEGARVLVSGRKSDVLAAFAAETGCAFATCDLTDEASVANLADTAAAQRALELEADILMKATRVDGVYSDDPEKNPHAMLYRDLTYQQVLEQNLRVMDATAISQCMEHAMPILVFNYRREGNIERAVSGERVGTLVGARRE